MIVWGLWRDDAMNAMQDQAATVLVNAHKMADALSQHHVAVLNLAENRNELAGKAYAARKEFVESVVVLTGLSVQSEQSKIIDTEGEV